MWLSIQHFKTEDHEEIAVEVLEGWLFESSSSSAAKKEEEHVQMPMVALTRRVGSRREQHLKDIMHMDL